MDRVRAIGRWFTNLSRRAQIIAAIVALVVVCGTCGGVLAAIGAANPQPSTSGTSAQATSTATAHITQAHATATATHAAPTATTKPAATCQETGPVFGSTLAAFTAAYGASTSASPPPYTFPTDANQDADVIVQLTNGCVSDLVLSAFNATWTDNQTIAACAPYLPAGASQFNSDGPYIDFHSPLGEIVEQHAPGSCHLYGAPA